MNVQISKWICEIFLLLSGVVYVYTIERRAGQKRKLFLLTAAYFIVFAGVNYLTASTGGEEFDFRLGGFLFLAVFLHSAAPASMLFQGALQIHSR